MKTLLAIVPTAGVTFLFVLAIRALVQADRRERHARAKIEAEEDRRDRAAGQAPPTHS